MYNPNQKRVLIVDVSHMCIAYANTQTKLTSVVNIGGQSVVIDTTIPALLSKTLFNWSHKGFYPTIVCFDSKGCNACRKYYFENQAKHFGQEEPAEYKSKRGSQSGEYFRQVNNARDLLVECGLTVLEAYHYEADDLVCAAVQAAKRLYPNCPIDVVTGDLDLAPLVDDQVSVFMRTPRMDYAEDNAILKKHYQQLTPLTYKEFLEQKTSTGNLNMAYNTLLLSKLLRGDKSDNVPAYPKFTPKKYNELIDKLISDGVDVKNLFRYDAPTVTYYYKGTKQVVPNDKLAGLTVNDVDCIYSDPQQLNVICNVLSKYLDTDIINHIRFVYNGINLNNAFLDAPADLMRQPAVISSIYDGFDPMRFKEMCYKRFNIVINI